MGDEDVDKRQKYFEDRTRERERQLKEKKKLLDGSDSEVDEGDVKCEGRETDSNGSLRYPHTSRHGNLHNSLPNKRNNRNRTLIKRT